MNIKESINHNYIEINPACARFNGTDDVVSFGKPTIIQSIGTSDFYLAVLFKVTSRPASIRNIAGSNQNGATTTTRFGIQIRNDGLIQYSVTFGSTLNVDTTHNIAIDDGKVHFAVMNVDRDNRVICYLDGEVVQEVSISAASAFDFVPARSFRVGAFSSSTDTAQLFFPGDIYFVSSGKRLLSGLEIACPEKIRTVSNCFACYMNGHGALEYDLTGNGVNGTWAGTGTHNGFIKGQYPYLLREGYSLYTKESNPDIQIPYGFDGNPLNSPTVPSGYTLSRNVAGDLININLASAMFDFNPESRVIASIAILDRSNVTYQTNTSRASSFYDSTKVFAYHTSELKDFDTYHSFFNTDYENRFYSKLVKSGSVIVEIERFLLYTTNKTESESSKIKTFCKIT